MDLIFRCGGVLIGSYCMVIIGWCWELEFLMLCIGVVDVVMGDELYVFCMIEDKIVFFFVYFGDFEIMWFYLGVGFLWGVLIGWKDCFDKDFVKLEIMVRII